MARQLRGRTQLISSVATVDSSNVTAVLERVLPDYIHNQLDAQYLYDYYLGIQDIRFKEKKFRPDINHKFPVNHAHEVANFLADQMFSDPIQYVRRGMQTENSSGNDGTSEEIAKLNAWMDSEDKAAVDADIGLNQAICGTAYRMVLPDSEYDYGDDSPFEMESLDPKTTAIVYNSGFGHKPLMSIQEVRLDDGDHLYVVYTANDYFEISDTVPSADGMTIIRHLDNPLGLIPIIEYPANPARLGVFEPAMGIWDAINHLSSNRLDSVDQFVQFLIKFVNCDFGDASALERIAESGAIAIKSLDGRQADVEILSAELNQTHVQILVDDLYRKAMKICNIPMSSEGVNGADTGASSIYRDGWEAFDKSIRKREQYLKRSERKFLRLVLKICKDVDGFSLPLTEIEVKFTRNRTDNLLVKTQGMLNQLQAGIHPQVVITNSSMYNDPEQVYVDSIPYLDKWLRVDKPSVNQNSNGMDANPNTDPEQTQRSVENANGTFDT